MSPSAADRNSKIEVPMDIPPPNDSDAPQASSDSESGAPMDIPPPNDDYAPVQTSSKKNRNWVPLDRDAERAVVSVVLTSPEALDDLMDVLDVEDFGDPATASVFAAMLECHHAGRPVDLITVADQMRADDSLGRIDGIDGLTALADSGTAVANVSAHAEIVADKAELRRVILAGRSIATDAMKPDAEGMTVRQNAERVVFELGRDRGKSSLMVLADAVPQALAELARTQGQELLGATTGLADLDKLTGGLQPGQLITCAARPGVGKSAFALQLAKHFAEVSGRSAAFLSWEMSSPELLNRLLASELRYDAMKLRQGELAPGMDLDLARAAEKLSQVPLYIDDNPPQTIGGVRSSMRRLARRSDLGLVVVDYMQLLESERRNRGDMNRTEEVSEISRGLKRLAVELGVPVLALSQLSRALEQRPNKRPILSDLRESGSIEQDSNSVWFLYRDFLYNGASDPTEAELIIAKQRSGPTGTVALGWHGGSASFSDRPKGQYGGGGGGYEYGAAAPAQYGGKRREEAF